MSVDLLLLKSQIDLFWLRTEITICLFDPTLSIRRTHLYSSVLLGCNFWPTNYTFSSWHVHAWFFLLAGTLYAHTPPARFNLIPYNVSTLNFPNLKKKLLLFRVWRSLKSFTQIVFFQLLWLLVVRGNLHQFRFVAAPSGPTTRSWLPYMTAMLYVPFPSSLRQCCYSSSDFLKTLKNQPIRAPLGVHTAQIFGLKN